jgi:hypothetical protein
MKNEAIVFRLSYKGKGPFYEAKIFNEVVRESRKITPEWAKELEISSWIEYYCAHAPSPYDNEKMDYILSRDSKNEDFLFGFASLHGLQLLLGLDKALYNKQFNDLLKKKVLVLTAYLVNVYAENEHEVMFRKDTCEFVENIIEV